MSNQFSKKIMLLDTCYKMQYCGFRIIDSLLISLDDLLVCRFKITLVMLLSNFESHCHITLQNSISPIHSFCRRFPALSRPRHNRTIAGEVHTVKLNVVIETVLFQIEAVDKEISQTQ